MIFGITMEKRFGTLFFAAINIWAILISNGLHLLYIWLRVYILPEEIGGGSTEQLSVFGIGYSAVLFGILMLECLSGDKHVPVFGCKVRKILLPFGYLAISQMLAPNADLIGHLTGIICGPLLKYCGFLNMRPQKLSKSKAFLWGF